jgi:signal transduction histidine kinase
VTVSGDETRLKQIVWNLLSNAVKFTPRGGHVVADVRQRAGRAELRISDTGEGIDAAFLPDVFDGFRQGASRSKRAGLGLGLAIVRHLTELHGGTVMAESDGVGRGAAFTVSLPAERR